MKISHSHPLLKPKRKYSIGIQVFLSVYALLYAVLVIYSFIPSPQGSPLADHPYTPWDIEMILVKLLFVIFMIGYYASWKDRRNAGLLLLCWCVAVVWDAIYIGKLLHVSGDSIMFIPPILIIALILIATGIKER